MNKVKSRLELSKKLRSSPRYILSIIWRVILFALCSLLIGAATGVADAIFGRVLLLVNDFRSDHTYYLLPFLALAGLLIVFIYQKFGRDSSKGMNLLFEKVQHKRSTIGIRLIPLVVFSTWITHLFGGSSGREGVAVQIGGTIGNFVSEKTGIKKSGRIFLISGMAAGFSGLFRTPIAAVFFALEVLSAGKIEISALLPALLAALTASYVSGLFGLKRFSAVLETDFNIDFRFVLFLCIGAVLFGIVGGLFAYIYGKTKKWFAKWIKNPYIRVGVIGAILSVVFMLLWNGRYSGLSTDLVSAAFGGGEVYPCDFAFKFILTIATLSAGYQGGEVTPLFIIGTTFGAMLGPIFGMPVMLFSALGYAAVFGAATNTLIAPMFIGGELFGYQYLPCFFLVCSIAYVFNGNNSIYPLQIKADKHNYISI